ncbi:hypothetical protein HYDPIDRAFT_166069 [Hydnomerulius pinastri MD-312]|nr:hypothetical protein HYDPIDRAFT_166069 [Hydnomerulius pinastri MD-312]
MPSEMRKLWFLYAKRPLSSPMSISVKADSNQDFEDVKSMIAERLRRGGDSGEQAVTSDHLTFWILNRPLKTDERLPLEAKHRMKSLAQEAEMSARVLQYCSPQGSGKVHLIVWDAVGAQDEILTEEELEYLDDT